MIEIKSIDQAEHLYECYFVPSEDLDRRANKIAEGVMPALEKNKDLGGDVCSHYGGDYWFHFGEKSEASNYFCNIPPDASDFYFNSVVEEKYFESALKFLVKRNTFFKRALDYLRNEME